LLEPFDGLFVVRVGGEHLAIDLDGLFGVVENLVVDVPGLVEELFLLLEIFDVIGLVAEDLDELLPVVELPVQLLELLDRLEVVRIDFEHLVQPRRRIARSIHPVEIDRRRTPQQIAPQVRIRFLLGLRLEDLHKRPPVVDLLGEPIQFVQRLLGLWILAERAGDRLEGRPRVAPATLPEIRGAVQ